MELDGKVAIITGGASGIGRASVSTFLREGARVVIADINLEGARTVVVEEEAAGFAGRVVAVRTDVGSWDDVRAMVAAAVDAFGRLDVIFNNAGIPGGYPILEQEPDAHYYPIMRVDLDGVYFGILAAARQFAAQGTPGVIINTSSIYGQSAGERALVYGAAKAGVISLTRSAALELAEHDIRVVAITPGRANTPIIARFSEELTEFMAKEQLRGRLTEPSEIGEVVAFLASDRANAINGTVVSVDDGYIAFKNRLPLGPVREP
ncbi:sorbitol-6-phosphate 2-dehydrogenase [Pseudoclavibacter endophyticus]|uniref:SDR family oxidoreductase n=1 Tax=Pseudoclavibacter endophyticus TaxID=1778590 RepID=A0A6H9WU62_9MICO|nr:SDR family oxidoreductase [Pseudoclavibacter endophyticus]KAB1650004.1 SDR family oxidoreductase [Pseudoclavibacter endophyticus]GGA58044.1 sorbitol-6-phosphate 2-dehydrogenase [Pseudoclavibacter endophyticus]